MRSLEPGLATAPTPSSVCGRSRVCRLLALLLLGLVAAAVALANGSPVDYQISLDQRAHHQLRITATFREVSADPLQVRMSRSSPGRYALHEFAKNVYDVEVMDATGRALPVERKNPHQWDIKGHRGTVVFAYTLYADHVDGTYAAVDSTHAHLNIPATLAWARGLEERPARLRFDLPEGWRLSSQLPAGDGPAELTAPDLDYLMDSPIEASAHALYEWTIPAPPGGERERQTVRVALHHLGTEAEAEVYVALAEAIVAEQIAVFGEPPAFDYGEYTFLADYLPWSDGDGMEHRNSTVLASSSSLAERTIRLLGTVSHEFFHAWNIERIRPRSLEPFDLERANMSGELWFGEGFTSYYGQLTLKRAGIVSLDRYAEGLSETLAFVLGSPGRRHRSPVEMSQQAPFVDAATWNDPTNSRNNFISYYSYGSVLALGLDLELRARSGRGLEREGLDPQGLDDFMAAMWRRHGRTEIAYTNDDLGRVLAEVTGDADWASAFFDRFVFGRELPDYERLLALGGLALGRARPEGAWWGSPELRLRDGAIELRAATLEGTPLYEAGLDRADRILAVDGQALASLEELEDLLKAASPGDTLRLEVERRGVAEELTVQLAADPAYEVVPFEHVEREVTAEIRAFRESWLGSRSGHRLEHRRHCPKCRRSYAVEKEHCPWDGERLLLVRRPVR